MESKDDARKLPKWHIIKRKHLQKEREKSCRLGLEEVRTSRRKQIVFFNWAYLEMTVLKQILAWITASVKKKKQSR